MMYSASEIMDLGFACLVENLGIVNAEHFIAEVSRQKFDYTAWQREYFDKIPTEELQADMAKFLSTHEHEGHGKRI